MLVTEQEIIKIKEFISQLNGMEDSVVMVEGKRDARALQRLGFSGKLMELHKFGRLVDFADYAAQYKKAIILFDRDRKGRYLTGKTIQLLARRTKIDLSFRRRLYAITKGQVMFTEQLRCYEPMLSRARCPFD